MKLITSIIFTLLIQFSFAQDISLQNKESIVSAIKKTAKSTQSITADFVQTKKLSYLKEPIITSGKFYSQGEKMRWQQSKPYTYIMLISEAGLKIKDEDKEKKYGEMAEKFIGQIRKILQSSINADFESNEDLKPSYFENKNYYKVVLEPQNRQLKKMYKSIELSFDKTSFRLKMLTFVVEEGSSEMRFMNEEFNNELKTTLFTNF